MNNNARTLGVVAASSQAVANLAQVGLNAGRFYFGHVSLFPSMPGSEAAGWRPGPAGMARRDRHRSQHKRQTGFREKKCNRALGRELHFSCGDPL
jgi:hypothetical protein